ISPDALPEDNIRLQDALGLSRAVVVSGGGYGRTTRHLVDVLERFPTRFRGVALLPEQVSDAEFERLTGLGVRGLRFACPGQGVRQALRPDALLEGRFPLCRGRADGAGARPPRARAARLGHRLAAREHEQPPDAE